MHPNLRPLGDVVIMRRLPPPSDDGQSVMLTDRPEPSICEVVAVGPGKWLVEEEMNGKRLFQPTSLKPGDRVVIGSYMDFVWEGEDLMICREADVRAVVEEVQ